MFGYHSNLRTFLRFCREELVTSLTLKKRSFWVPGSMVFFSGKALPLCHASFLPHWIGFPVAETSVSGGQSLSRGGDRALWSQTALGSSLDCHGGLGFLISKMGRWKWKFAVWCRELKSGALWQLRGVGQGGRWQGSSKGRRHTYTYGWFMLICGRNIIL